MTMRTLPAAFPSHMARVDIGVHPARASRVLRGELCWTPHPVEFTRRLWRLMKPQAWERQCWLSRDRVAAAEKATGPGIRYRPDHTPIERTWLGVNLQGIPFLTRCRRRRSQPLKNRRAFFTVDVPVVVCST